MRNKKSWQEVIENVLIAAINKGQFLTAVIGIFFIILAVRLPQKDLAKFVEIIMPNSQLGYVLFIICLFGWRKHVLWLRKKMEAEINRLADERNSLQKEKLGDILESSEEKEGRK